MEIKSIKSYWRYVWILRREVNVEEKEPVMVRSACWTHNDSSKKVHSILVCPHEYGIY